MEKRNHPSSGDTAVLSNAVAALQIIKDGNTSALRSLRPDQIPAMAQAVATIEQEYRKIDAKLKAESSNKVKAEVELYRMTESNRALLNPATRTTSTATAATRVAKNLQRQKLEEEYARLTSIIEDKDKKLDKLKAKVARCIQTADDQQRQANDMAKDYDDLKAINDDLLADINTLKEDTRHTKILGKFQRAISTLGTADANSECDRLHRELNEANADREDAHYRYAQSAKDFFAIAHTLHAENDFLRSASVELEEARVAGSVARHTQEVLRATQTRLQRLAHTGRILLPHPPADDARLVSAPEYMPTKCDVDHLRRTSHRWSQKIRKQAHQQMSATMPNLFQNAPKQRVARKARVSGRQKQNVAGIPTDDGKSPETFRHFLRRAYGGLLTAWRAMAGESEFLSFLRFCDHFQQWGLKGDARSLFQSLRNALREETSDYYITARHLDPGGYDAYRRFVATLETYGSFARGWYALFQDQRITKDSFEICLEEVGIPDADKIFRWIERRDGVPETLGVGLGATSESDAILVDMKDALLNRFGSLLRAWQRNFDPCDIGSAPFRVFASVLRDAGFSKAKEAWDALQLDGDLTFEKLDGDTYRQFSAFDRILQETFGDYVLAWVGVFDTHGSNQVAMAEFQSTVKFLGYPYDAKSLCNILQPNSANKYLTLEDVNVKAADSYRLRGAPPEAVALKTRLGQGLQTAQSKEIIAQWKETLAQERNALLSG